MRLRGRTVEVNRVVLCALLISQPDTFALNSDAGVLGTGVIFDAVAGWMGEKWDE